MKLISLISLLVFSFISANCQNFNIDNEQLNTEFISIDNNSQLTPTLLDVTFYCEMYDAPFDHAVDNLYISGSFNNWLEPGAEGSIQLFDYNESYYFTTTIKLPRNSGKYQYKYFINSGFEGAEWEGEPYRTFEVRSSLINIRDIWNDFVGISDIASESDLYPNPFTYELTLNNLSKASDIVIRDILGKTVIRFHTTLTKISINTSNLKNGIYFISIIDENKQIKTEKIIKR